AARQEGSGFWGRLVTAVMRRPIPMAIGAAVLLLAVASPILQLRTGLSDITAFPPSIDGVAGIELLNQKWPSGTELQLSVVVTEAQRADTQAALATLKTQGLTIPGLSQPVTSDLSKDGTVAMVS